MKAEGLFAFQEFAQVVLKASEGSHEKKCLKPLEYVKYSGRSGHLALVGQIELKGT